MKLISGTASAALLSIGVLWMVGFAWFSSASEVPYEPPQAADGIVVLTGAADRIDTALHLLADGRAPWLLVSGVPDKVDLNDLARRVPLDASQVVRVTLGRTAQSTMGNAAETAPWARAHGITQLIVVTSGYHMPRALLELQRALPEAKLHPVTAKSPAVLGWPPLAAIRVLAGEYDKLLAVRAGLAPLLRSGPGS